MKKELIYQAAKGFITKYSTERATAPVYVFENDLAVAFVATDYGITFNENEPVFETVSIPNPKIQKPATGTKNFVWISYGKIYVILDLEGITHLVYFTKENNFQPRAIPIRP